MNLASSCRSLELLVVRIWVNFLVLSMFVKSPISWFAVVRRSVRSSENEGHESKKCCSSSMSWLSHILHIRFSTGVLDQRPVSM